MEEPDTFPILRTKLSEWINEHLEQILSDRIHGSIVVVEDFLLIIAVDDAEHTNETLYAIISSGSSPHRKLGLANVANDMILMAEGAE